VHVQRDFYLSGFAALLILVLNRIYLLVKEVRSGLHPIR